MVLFWIVIALSAISMAIAMILIRFFSLLKSEATEERQKALEELKKAEDEVVDFLKEHLSPLIRLAKAFGQIAIIAIRGKSSEGRGP